MMLNLAPENFSPLQLRLDDFAWTLHFSVVLSQKLSS